MPRKTFKVTHPNGEVSTRTSATKQYAYAVVVGQPRVTAAAGFRAQGASANNPSVAEWYEEQARKVEQGQGEWVYGVSRWSETYASASKAACSSEVVRHVKPGASVEVVPVEA